MIWMLLACTGEEEKGLSCKDLPEVPVVTGCMSAIPGGDLTGTITALGEGPFPDGCDYGLGEDPGTGWWITVADESGQEGTIGLAIPDLASPFVAGDAAHLLAAYEMADFGPTIATVEVRDGLDALVGWVGIGGRVSDLSVPLGMVLSQGPEVCTLTEDCGSWAAYDLILEADGHRQTVSYGQQATVGNWTAYHAGNRQQINATGCPDWYVSTLATAIRR